ncbi:MAG: hypothetical protein R6V01_06125 [Thermoplasmatota archaeon]
MERYISKFSDGGAGNIMMEDCCGDVSFECDCSNIPENRMCVMTNPPFKFDIEKVKDLTNDPKYICRCCGRTANERENLCGPTDLR